MDMNNVNIEEIVKQVLSGMTGNAPAAAAATSAPAAPAGNTIPKKARVAMMTEKKHFELQEYDLPSEEICELIKILLSGSSSIYSLKISSILSLAPTSSPAVGSSSIRNSA